MGASVAHQIPRAIWRDLLGGDLLWHFFGNPLFPALLATLGCRLLQGLYDLFEFGFFLTTGLERYHQLASSSVYPRSSSGPPNTSAPRSSATRKNLSSDL